MDVPEGPEHLDTFFCQKVFQALRSIVNCYFCMVTAQCINKFKNGLISLLQSMGWQLPVKKILETQLIGKLLLTGLWNFKGMPLEHNNGRGVTVINTRYYKMNWCPEYGAIIGDCCQNELSCMTKYVLTIVRMVETRRSCNLKHKLIYLTVVTLSLRLSYFLFS